MKWEDIIIRNIKANNEFNISEVKDFHTLLNAPFHKDEYSKIVSLIHESNWEKIKSLQVDYDYVSEYLDVVKFTDQNGKVYVATTYDSDTLEQDPQLIDIFPVSE